MDVTVAVATFGDAGYWNRLAARAVASAERLAVPVVRYHGQDLQEARNTALARVETEWVCFLDADDELEPGYFDQIAAGTADLRAPAVRYVRGRGRHLPPPIVPKVAGHAHACEAECLAYGNFLVIGTVAPTELVKKVGGFDDFSWSEDWNTFVKCWQAGATVETISKAVYRAYVRPGSRNRAPSRQTKLEAHRQIARARGLPVP